MSGFWAARAVVGGRVLEGVAFSADAAGRVDSWRAGVRAPAAALAFGLITPGFANAHSHAFHRRLRGRTHSLGGDFWRWREAMYAAAEDLEPDTYHELATGLFRELAGAGYTAVGEFHYLRHRRDGSPYPSNAMELALAEAARDAGIRLTLLDACYLTGGIGQELTGAQRRFGDGDAAGWLDRWGRLRDALAAPADTFGLVRLGAAAHSVRAVPPAGLARIAAELPAGVPIHTHLSETPQENRDCVRAYGLTPTQVMAEAGLLGPRLAAVHATHLTPDDIVALGASGATVVACPTTEADLGDGIGPARALADAGARLAIGSDQQVVIDPFRELASLEGHQRLALRRRGVFSPPELWRAGQADGYRCLGFDPPLELGGPCDFIELDPASPRTAGSQPDQIIFAAGPADVLRTVVGGRPVGRTP